MNGGVVNERGPGVRAVLRFGVLAAGLVEQFDLGFASGGLLDVLAELFNGLLGSAVVLFARLEGADVVLAVGVAVHACSCLFEPGSRLP